jgi:hypothetical protein
MSENQNTIGGLILRGIYGAVVLVIGIVLMVFGAQLLHLGGSPY